MPPEHPAIAFFDLPTTRRMAWVSGVVSFILIAGLSWYGIAYRPIPLFDAPEFLALKEEIRQNPTHEQLIAAFRAEDLTRRSSYFDAVRKLEAGGLFLFVSLSVLVLALRRIAFLRERPPTPLESVIPEKSNLRLRRAAVADLLIPLPVACVILASFAWYAHVTATESAVDDASLDGFSEGEAIAESRRWNQLRGGGGMGIAGELDAPLTWDVAAGENIAWKTPIPLKGHSSPIVWGDRVFLTGADDSRRVVYCYDLESGALLWEAVVDSPAVVDDDMIRTANMSDSGFAAPTPVVDGRQVVAFFGTNEIAAFDFSGRQIWSRWLGKPNSFYGVATSLRLHEGRVFLQLDQGDEDDPQSAIYAFQPEDGRVLWKTGRDVPASWSTPIVADTGDREELLTAANPWVIAYAPSNGVELWRAKVLKGDVAPLPVYGGGFVFTAVDYAQLSAVEAGGSGDVTDTHLRWTYDEELPDIPSPLTDGVHLLLPTSYGYLVFFDARTGEVLWVEKMRSEFWSSPTLVGDRVYLTDTEGKTFVFRFGPRFEMLGGGEVGEKVVSTPAFVESRILIRGEEHLFCIGSKEWPADKTTPL